MSPDEKGAFCNVCSKTVIDFTSLSDEEVQNYFLNNRGKKNCGRFRNDQLINANDPLKQLLADAIPFWKKFLAIVLVVFGSFLSGCQDETTVGIVMPEMKINTVTIIPELKTIREVLDTQLIIEYTHTVGMIDIGIVEIKDEEMVIEEKPVADLPLEGCNFGYCMRKVLDENGCEKFILVNEQIEERQP